MAKKRVKNQFSVNDKKLKMFISNKDELSASRIRFYDLVFDDLYELMKLTPSEIVDKCIEDQKLFLENGLPVKKEISDRFVSELQTDYYEWLKKEKNSKGKPLGKRTIQTKISSLRHFLDKYNVELPDAPEIKIKKTRVRDNEIPTWDDVNLAIQYAKSPRDKAIIGFAATTGFRVSDIANLKINHLIRACSIYFEENEEHTLENLLEKDPENICPCWDMDPQKTIWHGNLAITFNTHEVSVLLWQYLNYRIELNDRNGRGRIIDGDEPLFNSQTGGHLDPVTISAKCADINKKMGGELDRNEVYGKFRIHNLRSLFKTTCKRNLYKVNVDSDIPFDGDVVNLFTGHSSNNAHADVYEAVPEDSTDSYVRKVYEGLMPYLSISRPSEVRSYSTKEYLEVEEYKKEVEEKFRAQEINYQRDMDKKDKEIEELKQQLAKEDQKHKTEISDLKSSVGNMQKQVDSLTFNRNRSNIEKIIMDYFDANYKENIIGEEENLSIGIKKCNTICKLAYELAVEEESNFRDDEEYLNSLIQRAIVKYTMNPNIDLFDKEELTQEELELMNKHLTLQLDLIELIKSNSTLWNMVKDDQIKLKNIIVYVIKKNLDNIDDLTDDDKRNMVQEVLMEYLKVD